VYGSRVSGLAAPPVIRQVVLAEGAQTRSGTASRMASSTASTSRLCDSVLPLLSAPGWSTLTTVPGGAINRTGRCSPWLIGKSAPSVCRMLFNAAAWATE
jgi:hypothetical protein